MAAKNQRGAMADVTAAAAVYVCAGSWLVSVSSPGPAAQVLAVAAGGAVLVRAGLSILLRARPVCTPADRVTLIRAVLVACCAALTVSSFFGGQSSGPLLLVIFGAMAFALDAVDGPVARSTRSTSPDGARFDAETDAALTLVLSFAAAAHLGPWTLLPGLMYYAFSAAGRFRPSLARTLPASLMRKTIGGLQPAALLFALVPGIPVLPQATAVAIALALLTFSFGRDLAALELLRRAEQVSAGTSGALEK